METLSGIRIVHCLFHCGRRSFIGKQDLVLSGLQQKGVSLSCSNKEVLRRVPKFKASVQDGTTVENTETLLEQVSQTEVEEEVNNNVMASEGSTLEVRFVLQKKCKFGQRFNVVGNDPLFGNWEVEMAVPMTWADGDIWTVEVNVPVDKRFEFKFVLTGEQGEVVWQPGANRVFQTEGNISSLIVNESWESVNEVAAGDLEDTKVTSTTSDTGITSETNGLQVPLSMSGTDNVSKDEIEEALKSKDDATDGHSTTLIPPDADTAPEVPVAELDLVATAAKSMVSADTD